MRNSTEASNEVEMSSISVVIPVKNEARNIRACIDGILQQSVPVQEIIVIDSGSTDDTLQILKTYSQVKILEIPSADFNHGETRNLGVQHASGEFVLLTVGDARPASEYWIAELLKGFTDSGVAGVCGQQIVPHDRDKNPIEWFNPVSEPQIIRYQFNDAAAFESLSPLEKKTICGWDDVTAMYRRTMLLETPFQKTSYSEDAIWAKEVILKGYAISYNHKARVYHYHLENADFTFKRNFTTMYFRYRQFGYLYTKPELSIRTKLTMLKTLIRYLQFDIGMVLHWYRYNLQNFRASVRSYKVFMQSLQQGEDQLDRDHEKYCGKPPISLRT